MFYKGTRLIDSSIGKVSDDWEVVELGNVILEAKSGFASGKRDKNGILQLRMNNIETDGRINKDAGVKVPIPPDVDEYVLRSGDVLFNNTNSVDLIGKTAIFRGEFSRCVYSNHLTRIRVNPSKVASEWILYSLIRKWQLGFFKTICHRHVHQAGINKNDLLKVNIPLPSLSEQQKIFEVLSVVDLAIGKVDEVIAKTERLKNGLMQELLTKGIGHKEFKETKIGKRPKTWQVVELEKVSKDFISGGTPSTKKPKFWNGNIPWIRSVHITRHFINYSSVEQYITKEGLEYSAANIVPKDNLIVTTRVGIGKSAVNLIDVAINQDLTGIVLDRSKVDSEFIVWYLHSPRVIQLFESFSRGTTIKGITQSSLRNLRIPLPSLPEQQKIAKILSTVDKKVELERKEKAKLERIKRGLMDLLLTGKVRVKVAG